VYLRPTAQGDTVMLNVHYILKRYYYVDLMILLATQSMSL